MLTLRQAFTEAVKVRKIRNKTSENYFRKLKCYAGPLLDLPLEQLTREVLESQVFSIVARLQSAGSKKTKDGYGTAQLVLAAISVIYRTVGEELGLPHEPGICPNGAASLSFNLQKN